MPRVVAIIQARVGSSRLPGKVFADILGKPMLQRVYERVKKARLLDDVVIATSYAKEDDAIVIWGDANGIPVYRGGKSVNDVLGRYADVAQRVKADVIVRITADCPMHDARVIDLVVGSLIGSGLEYSSNVLPPTYPDGLDVEAFTKGELFIANNMATILSDREHVTPFIQRFQTDYINITAGIDMSSERWTVDEPADLEFVRAVYSELGEDFGFGDVAQLLGHKPELVQINSHIGRNEGYKKSLEEEAHAKDTLESAPDSGDLQ